MSAALSTRVKDLLRRDLRLGDDADIADDMPLIGGEFDLDSLDVVMLMGSIEKSFGVKLARDGSAERLFASVGTIVEHLGRLEAADPPVDAGGDPAAAAPAVDLAAVLDRLPHRPPFRFVTALRSVEPGVAATARWELTGDESFFVGHFPGNPIVPGVLVTEALAQAAGLVLAAEEAAGAPAGGGRLAAADVRFRSSVKPPATLELHATRGASAAGVTAFEVRAHSGGEVVAEGTLSLAIG
ncbi:phosphopantetheine-binding protein [Phycisphaera mikurensis]|uniref:Putative (3R)-hydroxymyristoyl-[acyl-carrier-protein] dehydratase n=1 Tax=Phycisphaera mikurensis (strain NBRC 102666 / KCTC 22515 / FYK2301M01) TaxID=1142394 RepID=I0IJ08_PHYMF|nr:phosphopantetheine-binding protein [Phycisphaera mikurensis]MBB6443093.1 3-hydroxyacyl-[acyl-carrier-protein] dehydratase [Phycisphaera mikurensis]BAM05246.1 putative (3R)-hydroxymyristoyl-[acyl-carrier-protein] dehydratase [Phycisphaera mikurensis NBRC 102666]